MRPTQALAYSALIVLSYIVFAVALLAVYFTPTRSWALWLPPFLLVPAAGGWLLGRWSTVVLAAVCETTVCTLLIFADHQLFRVGPHRDLSLLDAERVALALLSVVVTMLGVRARRARTRSLA